MRKKISCKVVRSVTLGQSADDLQCVNRSSGELIEAGSVASLTYTCRLAVTRTDIDEAFAAGTLDLSA